MTGGPRKKRDPWLTEFEYATTICATVGCVVARSAHAYEIATVKGDGISLVIYEHTNTNKNTSARVRDNGSKNKNRAREVMLALKRGDGLPEDIRWKVATYNTFYSKHLPGNAAALSPSEQS